MKIDSSYAPTAAGLAPKGPLAQQTSPAGATTEAVSLSPLAGSLRGGEAPPVNSTRIQEIKQAIAEGRFKINPEAIADRLIESARDLVSASHREA
ncbi:flagellar biosynthesis anti-sigma factor FlgM [Azonexus sp.]|jgi:negative regulator of flagellin synthesis FlgM|uniref:flagellar biosynthesis anti-sigma factor FlgM n=1 Tax=Azonexus sp. TaxID=1872668 RepID=UPI00281839E6|nr:flagellar biosynthesis anti-sigma factor FlgM [Azonexus sp.]MDR1995052.1 flagellar biosynthesis anti-sigma factor FlgM [Azonexus sp.]